MANLRPFLLRWSPRLATESSFLGGCHSIRSTLFAENITDDIATRLGNAVGPPPFAARPRRLGQVEGTSQTNVTGVTQPRSIGWGQTPLANARRSDSGVNASGKSAQRGQHSSFWCWLLDPLNAAPNCRTGPSGRSEEVLLYMARIPQSGAAGCCPRPCPLVQSGAEGPRWTHPANHTFTGMEI